MLHKEELKDFNDIVDNIVDIGNLIAGNIKKAGRIGTLGWLAFEKETKCLAPVIITETIGLSWDIIVLFRGIFQFGYKYCGQGSDGCCIEPEAFWKPLLNTPKSAGKILYDTLKKLTCGALPASILGCTMLSSVANESIADLNTTAIIVALVLEQLPQVEISADIMDILSSIKCGKPFHDVWNELNRDYSGKDFEKTKGVMGWLEKLYDAFIARGFSMASAGAFMAGFYFLRAKPGVAMRCFVTAMVSYALHGVTDTVKLGRRGYKLVNETYLKKERENNQEDDSEDTSCNECLTDWFCGKIEKLKEEKQQASEGKEIRIIEPVEDEKGYYDWLLDCCKKKKKIDEKITVSIGNETSTESKQEESRDDDGETFCWGLFKAKPEPENTVSTQSVVQNVEQKNSKYVYCCSCWICFFKNKKKKSECTEVNIKKKSKCDCGRFWKSCCNFPNPSANRNVGYTQIGKKGKCEKMCDEVTNCCNKLWTCCSQLPSCCCNVYNVFVDCCGKFLKHRGGSNIGTNPESKIISVNKMNK
jgi:hypothetical protein